jgi:hypothetical protein
LWEAALARQHGPAAVCWAAYARCLRLLMCARCHALAGRRSPRPDPGRQQQRKRTPCKRTASLRARCARRFTQGEHGKPTRTLTLAPSVGVAGTRAERGAGLAVVAAAAAGRSVWGAAGRRNAPATAGQGPRPPGRCQLPQRRSACASEQGTYAGEILQVDKRGHAHQMAASRAAALFGSALEAASPPQITAQAGPPCCSWRWGLSFMLKQLLAEAHLQVEQQQGLAAVTSSIRSKVTRRGCASTGAVSYLIHCLPMSQAANMAFMATGSKKGIRELMGTCCTGAPRCC